MLLPTAANAGNGVLHFFLPCTGEYIAKVADVPGLRDETGRSVGLGYAIRWCGWSGEWVGHIGNRSNSSNLEPEALERAIAEHRLDSMPDVPGFWSAALEQPRYLTTDWAYALIGPPYFLIGILKFVAAERARNNAPQGPVRAPVARISSTGQGGRNQGRIDRAPLGRK